MMPRIEVWVWCVLFAGWIPGVACDETDPRSWRLLLALIDDAEKRNTAEMDRAMADGNGASGAQMKSNWEAVRKYLQGLSNEELLGHARDIINHGDKKSIDPDVVVRLVMNSLKSRPAKTGIAEPVLKIVADPSETPRFRSAIVDWWSARASSMDSDRVSKEARSSRPATSAVLLTTIADGRSPVDVRLRVLSCMVRAHSVEWASLVNELKVLGLPVESGEGKRMDMLLLARDDGNSMTRELRAKVRLMHSEEAELAKCASALGKEKDLSPERLRVLKFCIGRMKAISVAESTRIGLGAVEDELVKRSAETGDRGQP